MNFNSFLGHSAPTKSRIRTVGEERFSKMSIHLFHVHDTKFFGVGRKHNYTLTRINKLTTQKNAPNEYKENDRNV